MAYNGRNKVQNEMLTVQKMMAQDLMGERRLNSPRACYKMANELHSVNAQRMSNHTASVVT